MPDRPSTLPVIDVRPLVSGKGELDEVAGAIDRACREAGFFYVVGHGVDERRLAELQGLSKAFFARPATEKLRLRMELGGRAWRGYFPVGAEATSGVPDRKEGLYFGEELDADDPRVRAGKPMFGPNLFPDSPRFREVVLAHMADVTRVGHCLAAGVALALGLEADYFDRRYTREPLILFRIFHYPPLPQGAQAWSVGEHTDYGFLTLLAQDDRGGLEVRTPAGWTAAPPLPGALVCNIGDMLDRATGGVYRSTPHRVRNASGRSRLSFPFFFDPGFDTRVEPIDAGASPESTASERWDGEDVHLFDGTYGEYLLAKVARVFPTLGREVL